MADAPIEWTTRGTAHVLGDDVPHDGGVIAFEVVIARQTDPAALAPMLFAQVDPGLAARLEPGDFIVAGRNFLTGKAHDNGLIAMKALSLRVLCESMPVRALQNVVGRALPCLHRCDGIRSLVNDGDQIEVDMLAGRVRNLTTGRESSWPGVSQPVRELIESGGTRGVLERHLEAHPELRQSADGGAAVAS